MAKKSTPKKKKKATTAARKSPAGQLLGKIKSVDRRIVQHMNDRAQLVQKLHAVSAADARAACDADVVRRAIGETVTGRGPLSVDCVRSVFRELTSGTRALVAPLLVTYLGPRYSFSHLASVERFGGSVELIPVSTIGAVFEEVQSGQADRGLVPLENSTDGRIVDTLDMFARTSVKICGEVQLQIHHNLLGKCERSDIKEVISKPQALSQCRNWLAKHLPQAQLVEIGSTAAAAEQAHERAGVAAIASRQAATHYGLEIIAAAIEDNKNNITRFAVIGNEPAPRTGNDKTALMFEIPHQPGALADVMVIFKRSRLNLTWIESFPLRGGKNEYLFFVEFEGHYTEAKAKRALASLERKVVAVEVLGAYAKSEPIG